MARVKLLLSSSDDILDLAFNPGSTGSIIPGVPTSTKISIRNSDTGWKTIIKGTGITYDALTGEPDGGSMGTMIMKDAGGTVMAKIKFPGVDLPSFIAGVDALIMGDPAPLDAVISPHGMAVGATGVSGFVSMELTSGRDVFAGSDFGNNVRLGDGRDAALGGIGNDVIFGEGGRDLLLGGGGSDRLFGGAGRDILYGGAGRDLLKGGGGEDTLRGNRGNDKLFGNGGNDVFKFKDGDGNDQIMDFEVNVGGATRDQIDLADVSVLSSFIDMVTLNQITDDGIDTTITYGGNQIFIWNVTVSDLSDSDFIF